MDKTIKEAIEILGSLSEKEQAFALDVLRNLAEMAATKQAESSKD